MHRALREMRKMTEVNFSSLLLYLLLNPKEKKIIFKLVLSHCVEVNCARENSISLIERTICSMQWVNVSVKSP